MQLRETAWALKGRASHLPGGYDAFRRVTTRFGEGKTYTIRVGPMRGLRWRRRNALPYWYHLGLWEPHTSHLIAEHLRPGDVFWDVGANAGYHTLLAARLARPDGHVVAFEPQPDVADMLDDNVTLNGFGNCTTVRAAIADHDGTATFALRNNNLTAALADFTQGDPLEVEAITLDTALAKWGPPNLIKMDIEGGEVGALANAARLLDGRPRWLLSTHGQAARDFCHDTLVAHGYRVHRQPGMKSMLVAVEA